MPIFNMSLFDPNVYHFTTLASIKVLGGFLNLWLGLYIAAKSRGKPLFIAFSFVCLFTTAWITSAALAEVSQQARIVIWWVKWTAASGCVIAPAFYVVTVALFDQIKKKAILLSCICLAGLALAVTCLTTSLVATGAIHLAGGVSWGKPGPFYPVLGLFLFCVQVGAFKNLIQGYRASTTAAEKEKVKYVLLSFAVACMGDIDILPAMGFDFYPYGAFPGMAWLWILSYAIVSRRLMDIQTAALKTVVWLVTSLVVVIPLCVLFWFIHPWVAALSQTELLLALSALFVVFAFYWSAAQSRVDQIFQRRRYDLRQALADYVSDLTALKNFRQVQSQLNKILTARLYVESMALFVTEEGAGRYRDLTAQESGTPRVAVLAKDNPFIHWLQEKNEIVAADEVVQFVLHSPPPMQKAATDFLALKGDLRLIIPLTAQVGFVGWIALGPRVDGEPYRAVELDFLDHLRKNLAVAISNSLLYDQVQQFSVSLEATVRSRTRELQQANERLKQLDTAKTEFLAMANHELRNPLTAVRGFSETLTMLWDKLTEAKKKEIVSFMQDSTTHMLGLIEDYLDVAKMELGRFDLNRIPTRLCDLAGKVAEQMGVQYKRITFAVKFDDPDVTLTVDPDKMEQVLMNLAGNAAKYSSDEGEVSIQGRKEDGDFLMVVEDDGPGIPPDHLEKIFGKFYRVETAEPEARRGQQVRGSGLGLTIAKSIVEMHGGRIWAENRTDRTGARFCFSLPMS